MVIILSFRIVRHPVTAFRASKCIYILPSIIDDYFTARETNGINTGNNGSLYTYTCIMHKYIYINTPIVITLIYHRQ